MKTEDLMHTVESLKDEMVETMMELIRLPAIAPENGGEGESKKAEKLAKLLKTVGFDSVQRFDAEDARVPSKKRPNIVAYYQGGASEQTLWIVSHLDVVPSGEETLWKATRPFQPTVKEGKIYGRGSEDNTQSLVASVFAIKALKSSSMKPKRTVALCFVADEEQGSTYGIQHLIKKGLFKADDLVLVPDGGNENGTFIEVAEKSSLWLRIRTIGKQAHASRPDTGLNANRIGMQYTLALDEMLHRKYWAKDKCFEPPESTFEPTKKDRNVDAVNIIPGEDVNCYDCRILPRYDVGQVLVDIKALANEFEKKTGASIKVETLQKTVAPEPTDNNAKIVVMLKNAIRMIRKTQPKVGGIGGGTCAAFFRRAGIPAVVWSTVDEMAHQPDEYSKVENLVNDSKIFAYLSAVSS